MKNDVISRVFNPGVSYFNTASVFPSCSPVPPAVVSSQVPPSQLVPNVVDMYARLLLFRFRSDAGANRSSKRGSLFPRERTAALCGIFAYARAPAFASTSRYT